MSLSSETMMKLMAYVDGELAGPERAAAEKLLATDEDALRFVEQLAGLGEIVHEGHAARAGERIAAFDVADVVIASVKDVKRDPKVPTGEEGAPKRMSIAPVVALDVARAQRQQRMKIGAGVVAVIAFAAAVFVYARPSETPMASGPTAPPVQASATNPSPAANTAEQTASNDTPSSNGPGVEVSAVESPGHSVSVFYLPTANELSTSVVVWVDETGEK